MARIAFVFHSGRPVALKAVEDSRAWLQERGHEVVAPWRGDGTPGQGVVPPPDLVVAIGGDGTMLRAVDLAGPVGSPVLGVNVGALGYLTETEPSALPEVFGRFLSGEFTVEERMILEVAASDALGKAIALKTSVDDEGAGDNAPGIGGRNSLLALNEVVVEKTVSGHTVRVATAISGRPFLTYVADGLLVATPTGSTAYNLSARGPIVSPSLHALLLTPISAHMLFDRSVVLDPQEWVKIEILDARPAALVVDGIRVATLEPGCSIVARSGPHPARFVTFAKRDFYAILKAKFRLADR